MTTLLISLLVLNLLILVVGWLLYRRGRRAAREEAVETSDREESAQHLRELEMRERWESLDLTRLHPLNREAVEEVLERLRATSVRALSRQDRTLLERMVEAEARARRSAGGVSELGDERPSTAGA